MKTSNRKIEKTNKPEISLQRLQSITIVLFIVSLTSCGKAWIGTDGRPGDAYLALTWYEAEPTYIDAGTNAIPYVFYWDEYYLIQPGFYTLYYEGEVWTGLYWAAYAWDVTYEIWEIEGEQGDWYYHGEDGPDNYFTIECNPYGPYVGSSYKSTAISDKYELVEETENKVVVLQEREGVKMKITYKKVEPREKEVDKAEL